MESEKQFREDVKMIADIFISVIGLRYNKIQEVMSMVGHVVMMVVRVSAGIRGQSVDDELEQFAAYLRQLNEQETQAAKEVKLEFN